MERLSGAMGILFTWILVVLLHHQMSLDPFQDHTELWDRFNPPARNERLIYGCVFTAPVTIMLGYHAGPVTVSHCFFDGRNAPDCGTPMLNITHKERTAFYPNEELILMD